MATKTLSPWIINFFFYAGLISATLFRLIIFLNRVNMQWARTAWYIGVFGYILFFGFRYYIARKRRKTIKLYNLQQKIKESNMDEEARNELSYLLSSLVKSREIVNYIYIFVTSAVAVLIDMILVFMQ